MQSFSRAWARGDIPCASSNPLLAPSSINIRTREMLPNFYCLYHIYSIHNILTKLSPKQESPVEAPTPVWSPQKSNPKWGIQALFNYLWKACPFQHCGDVWEPDRQDAYFIGLLIGLCSQKIGRFMFIMLFAFFICWGLQLIVILQTLHDFANCSGIKYNRRVLWKSLVKWLNLKKMTPCTLLELRYLHICGCACG